MLALAGSVESVGGAAETSPEGGLVFAVDLNVGGVVAAKGRRLDEAEILWQRALEIRRQLAPGSLDEATTLNNLGVLAAIRGDLDQATRFYERALKIRRQRAPGSLDVAGVLNNLGVVLVARGQLERAEACHAEALEIRRALAPGGLDEAQSLHRLGIVAFHQGDLEKAAAYHDDALGIQQREAPGRLDPTNGGNELGALAFAHSESNWAAAYYDRGLEAQKRLTPASLGLALSWGRLNDLDSFRGDLDNGAGYHAWRRDLSRRIAVPGSLEESDTLHKLGILARIRGDLDQAAEFHRSSLEIRQQLAPESLRVASSLDKLGLLAYYRSDLERAVKYYREALEIQQKLEPNGLDLALTLGNLGNLARDQGDFEQATRFLEASLEMGRKRAPGSLSVALSLGNLGLLAQATGDFKRASDYLEQSLEIRRKLTPSSFGVASDLSILGDLSLARGALDEAVAFYEEALALNQMLMPYGLREAPVLHGLATVRRKQRLPDLALSLLHRAVEALGSQISQFGGSHAVQANLRGQYEELFHDTIDLSLQLGKPDNAFHLLERSRAQSFLAQLTERDLGGSGLPPELREGRQRIARIYDQKQTELAALDPKTQAGDIEALRAQLQHLRWQQDDLAETIRRESTRRETLESPQPLDVTAAQQVLDPGTLLLSYSVGETSAKLFVLTREGPLRVVGLDLDETTLRRDIQTWNQLIRRALPGDTTGAAHQFERLGMDLFRRLIEPVADVVARSERLLVVPSGPLHLLPWGALVRPGVSPAEGRKDWQYLAEWKPYHTVLSATVYAQLQRERKEPRPSSSRSASISLAAFGDPLLPRRGELRGDFRVRSAMDRGLFDGWNSLPHTRREVERIAALYPPETTRIYLEADATEEAVKVVSRKARILHLATHGHLDGHSPLDSAIVFTIPETRAIGRENGLLQAWEIFEEVRLKADLVVLSACSSGLGEEQTGEGLIGLTRAFQYAGARSVIASLWDVRDQATAELMVRFHRHLSAGVPKAEALRSAQLEFLNGGISVEDETGETRTRDYSAPYYWAPFQLYGDWR